MTENNEKLLTVEDFDRMLREVGVIPQNEQNKQPEDFQDYEIEKFSLLEEDTGSTIVTL